MQTLRAGGAKGLAMRKRKNIGMGKLAPLRAEGFRRDLLGEVREDGLRSIREGCLRRQTR